MWLGMTDSDGLPQAHLQELRECAVRTRVTGKPLSRRTRRTRLSEETKVPEGAELDREGWSDERLRLVSILGDADADQEMAE